MPHSYNSDALELFLSSIKGYGHLKYPILDSVYSPGSRVPCTDLVPFISERIIEGDRNSIKRLMRAVIEGNPGLGIGPGWMDESVEETLSILFEKYVLFSSTHALPELKALFIVAAKCGGRREFQITQGGTLRLISWACIAHQPSWSTNLYFLADKANSWIAKMAKNIPNWKEYERFNVREIPSEHIETELRENILALTPAARLQLFYVIERGGGSLPRLTNYEIRSLGINVDKTSKELIESRLALPLFSSKAIESAHSKKELLDICKSYGANYHNSWKKEKIVGSLEGLDSTVLKKIAKTKNLVSPNFQAFPELKNVIRIADNHIVGFKLLCFA